MLANSGYHVRLKSQTLDILRFYSSKPGNSFFLVADLLHLKTTLHFCNKVN